MNSRNCRLSITQTKTDGSSWLCVPWARQYYDTFGIDDLIPPAMVLTQYNTWIIEETGFVPSCRSTTQLVVPSQVNTKNLIDNSTTKRWLDFFLFMAFVYFKGDEVLYLFKRLKEIASIAFLLLITIALNIQLVLELFTKKSIFIT